MNQNSPKITNRTQETNNTKSSRLKWTSKILFLLFVAATRPITANVPLYKFEFTNWVVENDSQDVKCQASTIYFYTVWLTQRTSGDPLGFKIDGSKFASARGFIPVTGGSKYYLYEAGNDEYTHDGLDSKAQNHMIIVVAENDGVTTTGCKVTGLITEKLKPKGGANVYQLFSPPNGLYTLQDAAGTPATTASFGKVTWTGLWFHQGFYIPITFTFPGLTLAAIDERIVEMMILILFYNLDQPIAPGMLDLTETLITPNKFRAFPGNEFIPEYKPQDALKRVVHEDLPGYYLDVYNGASDDVSKILARVLPQNGPGGVQSELYIQKPEMLEVGVTHSIEIKTQQMKDLITNTNHIKPHTYRIDVTRTAAGNIDFQLFRGTNTAASLQISHPYSGGQNFIYFNFNVMRGVLYFLNPPTSGCRAKIYETLHVYEVGKTVQRVVGSFEESMSIAAATGRDDTNFQISTIVYGTIEYKPPNQVTSNIAVFKVMSFYGMAGVYPNFLLTDIDTTNLSERCYYPLPSPAASPLKKCLALAHLSGPSETQTLLYNDPLSKDLKTATGFLKERCRVTYNDRKCYTTMPGFLVNLNVERDGMPYGGVLTAAEYDALDAKKKGFVTEFTSNLGTRTFVSCPISCKKLYKIFSFF